MPKSQSVKGPNIMEGKVKNTFPGNGFGFIRGTDKRDYFFHMSELRGGLVLSEMKTDDPVKFDADPDYPKGARAIDIYPLKP